jgi:hypothetical protein
VGLVEKKNGVDEKYVSARREEGKKGWRKLERK